MTDFAAERCFRSRFKWRLPSTKSVMPCYDARFGVWGVRQTKKRNRGGRPAGIGDCRENELFRVSPGPDSSRQRYPMPEIDNLRELRVRELRVRELRVRALCVMALRRTKGLRVNRV